MKLDIDEVDFDFIVAILCRAEIFFKEQGCSPDVCEVNRDRHRENAKMARQAQQMMWSAGDPGRIEMSMEQSTLRELQLEESLRFAANALKYAAELVRALSYPDTTDASYLRIRYFEALRDLNPCEETERDLREAIEGAQANKAKRIEIRNGKEN